MKKRFLSLMLALCMACALVLPAAAAEDWSGELDNVGGDYLYVMLALNSAIGAKENVAVSKDGNDVPNWQKWTTQEIMDDFTYKLERTQTYFLSWSSLTAAQKDECAYSALLLQDATTEFKNGLKYGYQSDTPTQPETPAEVEPPFPDVAKDAWYFDYVRQVKDKKLFAGFEDGTFGPDKSMTIEQFFAVLYQFSGETRDIKGMDDYIAWATEKGLIPSAMQRGTSQKDAITRQQMAAAFDAFLKAYNVKYTNTTDTEPSYSDWSKVAEYARDGVTACWKAGIMAGDTSGAFNPDSSATRAQVAVVMVQMARVMGK